MTLADCYFHHSFSISNFSLARAVGIPVIPRSVGPLATMLVAIKNIFIFFFSQFFKKACLAKVDRSAHNSRGRHLSRPHRPFWDPLGSHFGFFGVAVFGVAGGEQVPPAPLGSYSSPNLFNKSCLTLVNAGYFFWDNAGRRKHHTHPLPPTIYFIDWFCKFCFLLGFRYVYSWLESKRWGP